MEIKDYFNSVFNWKLLCIAALIKFHLKSQKYLFLYKTNIL